MNTRLELLFEKFHISDKDKYEINQIYMLLPDIKKQNLINNFEILSLKLKEIEADIEIEKDILIWNAVERIKSSILEKRKNNYEQNTKSRIDLLKGEI